MDEVLEAAENLLLRCISCKLVHCFEVVNEVCQQSREYIGSRRPDPERQRLSLPKLQSHICFERSFTSKRGAR
jgi:hypothetical protein